MSEEFKQKISLAQIGKPQKKSKLILDTVTGIYYETVLEASKVYNINENTLWGYLNNTRPNKTNLKYVNNN